MTTSKEAIAESKQLKADSRQFLLKCKALIVGSYRGDSEALKQTVDAEDSCKSSMCPLNGGTVCVGKKALETIAKSAGLRNDLLSFDRKCRGVAEELRFHPERSRLPVDLQLGRFACGLPTRCYAAEVTTCVNQPRPFVLPLV